MKYGLGRPITDQDREAVMKALLETKFKPVTTGTAAHSKNAVKVFGSDEIKRIIEEAMVSAQTMEMMYGKS